MTTPLEQYQQAVLDLRERFFTELSFEETVSGIEEAAARFLDKGNKDIAYHDIEDVAFEMYKMNEAGFEQASQVITGAAENFLRPAQRKSELEEAYRYFICETYKHFHEGRFGGNGSENINLIENLCRASLRFVPETVRERERESLRIYLDIGDAILSAFRAKSLSSEDTILKIQELVECIPERIRHRTDFSGTFMEVMAEPVSIIQRNAQKIGSGTDLNSGTPIVETQDREDRRSAIRAARLVHALANDLNVAGYQDQDVIVGNPLGGDSSERLPVVFLNAVNANREPLVVIGQQVRFLGDMRKHFSNQYPKGDSRKYLKFLEEVTPAECRAPAAG